MFEQGLGHHTRGSTASKHFAARIWFRIAVQTPLINCCIIPIENGAGAGGWGIEWDADGGYVSAIVTVCDML